MPASAGNVPLIFLESFPALFLEFFPMIFTIEKLFFYVKKTIFYDKQIGLGALSETAAPSGLNEGSKVQGSRDPRAPGSQDAVLQGSRGLGASMDRSSMVHQWFTETLFGLFQVPRSPVPGP